MSQRLRRRLALSLAVLTIFAAFAPIVRLVFVHDDAYNIPIITTQTVLSVFGFEDYGHRDYRPLIAALWLLARDWFGDFAPAVLHWWSLATHTLVVVLSMALALRLSHGQRVHRTTFAVVTGLLMGTFPFSHQAVHWAGAIGHPLMALFGLAAVHCALTTGKRALVVGPICLLLACWSHEQGFVFGAIAPVMLAAMRLLQGRAPSRRDFAAGALYAGVAVVFVGLYLWLARTVWVSTADADQSFLRSTGIVDFAHSLAFNMQSFVAGAVVLLRYRILDVFEVEHITPVLFALFAALVGPALLLLRKFGALRLGLAAGAYWLVALFPSAAYLNHNYIEGAVRILYPTAPGIALFWGAVVAALIARLRTPLPRLAVLAAPAAFVIWSGVYLTDRLIDFDAYSRGMRIIAARVAASPHDTRVLFVNFPAASAPKNPGPAFLRGNEGVMFHTDFNGPPMILVNALIGESRPSAHVVHNMTIADDARFYYFATGENADDGLLRKRLLESSLVFRWSYDLGEAKRPRAQLLAEIRPAAAAGAPLATLTSGDARVDVREATARITGGDHVQIEIAWDARTPAEASGIFVHIYDAQGQIIAQADADLIRGYLPLEQMPTGMLLREVREIALPAGAVPATVHFGVYRRSDVQRWRTVRADGTPWNGDEIVVAVQ